MANTLGYYNPVFYAQEALIQLENAMGMASRVHRGYEEERRSYERGEYINIRRPSTFTAANAPSTAADITTESVQIQLAYWREVKFKLTDKELAFTSEKIIEDHIRPAAVALADDVDSKLVALYKDIPWYATLATTTAVTDITGPRKVMFDNKAPVRDMANMHYMIDGALEANFLGLSAFSQYQGAGPAGADTQRAGSLGWKYGVEVFANQNTPSHTAGTFSCAAPLIKTAVAAGASAATFDHASALTGTLVAGDIFSVAGSTQKYVVTATATAASNEITVAFSPPAAAIMAEDAAVTVYSTDHTADLMFHRNAFALAMAPLPMTAAELGARVVTVTDPITGLSIRSRIYYVGNSSEVHVALDILYGVKTLDEALACRGADE